MATSHLSPADPTRSLRLALRTNAGFSTTCALVFIADAPALAPLLGVPGPLLLALGVGLLGFSAMLVVTSLRGDASRLAAEARIHCAADLAWVGGSVSVLALGWLTPTGAIGLAGVSIAVLALALAQWRGIARTAAFAG